MQRCRALAQATIYPDIFQSLSWKTVEGRSNSCPVGVSTWENPAVNSTLRVADRIDGGGSKLEHAEAAVIEAEDLGATV